jgi:hypothetical protein
MSATASRSLERKGKEQQGRRTDLLQVSARFRTENKGARPEINSALTTLRWLIYQLLPAPTRRFEK